jgi:hypothetical protein
MHTGKQSVISGSSWPGPRFLGVRRKLTMPGGAIAPKDRFVAPARTHTGGHQPSLVNGGFRLPRLTTKVLPLVPLRSLLTAPGLSAPFE